VIPVFGLYSEFNSRLGLIKTTCRHFNFNLELKTESREIMSMRNSPSLIVHCLLWAAFLLIAHHPAPGYVSAQSATATLSGAVLDQDGAAVPEVNITLTNPATGLKREMKTNTEGYFTFALLPPGRYTVRAERSGFSPLQIPEVTLNVGDQRAIQIQLKVGKVDETVTVDGASLINESPAVGTVIDRQFVGNLPLNGRSFQSLILLTPGVTVVPSSDVTPGQFSVNGQRSNANYFTVDGVSANLGVSNSPTLSNFSSSQAGTVPGVTAFGGTNNLVSVDALEEFTIQTSTYSAEFGRQPGGQVQIATRAGGNDFHGTLFDYVRNEKFDANDWFTNSRPLTAQQTAAGLEKQARAPLRQNQFGGTFSGPLILPRVGENGSSFRVGRNKSFFFFSYEGQRLRVPTSGVAFVPSLRLRQVAAASVQPILNAAPIPNGPEVLSSTGQPLGYAPYAFSLSNPSNMNATSIRIDHLINKRITVFGRYSESPSNSFTRSNNTLSTPTESSISTRTITLGSPIIFNSKVTNDLRLNYSRNRGRTLNKMDNFGGAFPLDQSVLLSGYSGSGSKQGRAFVSVGGLQVLVATLGDTVDSFQRQANVVDNLSWVNGKHRIKLGVDYRRLTPIYGPREYQQFINLSNETAIVNGAASVIISAAQGARPIFNNFATYIQDSWKTTRRLTFEFGLRWDINPAPHDANGLKPVTVIGIENLATAMLATPNTPFFKTFYKAFAPRVGASYKVRDTPGREMVIRSGFGIYYDLGNGMATAGFSGLPFVATKSLSSTLPVPASQAIPPSFPTVSLPITSTLYATDPNLKLPYTIQWNLTAEQAIGNQSAVTLSYVAAIGRNLLTTQTINRRAGVTTGNRSNPNFDDINYTSNGPSSNYNAMQLQFKRRLSLGFQAIINYTWSHAIDEVSDEIRTGVLERGDSSFDVRHNFSAAATYITRMRSGKFLAHLLSDWSIDTILHLQSGFPVDITTGNLVTPEGTFLSVRPDLIPGVPLYLDDPMVPGGRRFNAAAFARPPSNPSFPSIPARQGTFGRNIMRALPLRQVDLALGRRFRLFEGLSLQLKAEAFNVFNTPNFASYGNSIASPTSFGVPVQTLNRQLGGLGSLYQVGGPRSLQLSAKLSF